MLVCPCDIYTVSSRVERDDKHATASLLGLDLPQPLEDADVHAEPDEKHCQNPTGKNLQDDQVLGPFFPLDGLLGAAAVRWGDVRAEVLSQAQGRRHDDYGQRGGQPNDGVEKGLFSDMPRGDILEQIK